MGVEEDKEELPREAVLEKAFSNEQNFKKIHRNVKGIKRVYLWIRETKLCG